MATSNPTSAHLDVPDSVSATVFTSRPLSWGAILAGAFVAIATSTMLHLFGVGVGAASISPLVGSTPDASTFTTAAALWLAFSTIVGLGVGGFVAGRLSTAVDNEDGILHGLTVWALAALPSAAVVGTAAMSIASAGVRGASAALGTATAAAAPAAADAVRGSDPRQMIDMASRALASSGDTAAMTPEERNAAMAIAVEQRIVNGAWTTEQRARAVDLVQRSANIPQEEANRRVAAVEQSITQAQQRAREAADAAAGATARASFWAFASLLIGAIAAAATACAGIHNRTWLVNIRNAAYRPALRQ